MKRESLLFSTAMLIVVGAAIVWSLQAERAVPSAEPGPANTTEPSTAQSSGPATALREITPSEPDVRLAITNADPADEARLADPGIQAALTGFTGRLVDGSGQAMPDRNMQIWCGELAPVMEAMTDVEAPRKDIDFLGGQERTDPSGRFLITGVWPRAVYLLVADAGGENPTFQFVERTPAPGQLVDLGDIRLKDSATLLGKVVDEDGQPVEGALVSATDLPSAVFEFLPFDRLDPLGAVINRVGSSASVMELPPWVAKIINHLPIPKTCTAADGTFRLTGVDTGAVRVAVMAKSFVPHAKPLFRLAVGEVRALAVLRLSKGKSLKGRVVDAHGKPVAGAVTLVAQRSLKAPMDFGSFGPLSDQEGRFEVSGFGPGKVTVAARRDGKSPWVIAEPASVTEELVITMPERFSLTLDVQGQDGNRIKDPTILLFQDMEGGGPVIVSAGYASGYIKPLDLTGRLQTAEDGRAVVQDLEAGRYVVMVRGKGFCFHSESLDLE